MSSFLQDFFFWPRQVPCSTSTAYYLPSTFDYIYSRPAKFDSKKTNNRISREEYLTMLSMIKEKCATEFFICKALNLLRFAIICVLLVYLSITGFNQLRMIPYIIVLGFLIHLLATFVCREIRQRLYKIASLKIDAYLEDLNKVKYHAKQLHWSWVMDKRCEYFKLELDYQGFALMLPSFRKKQVAKLSNSIYNFYNPECNKEAVILNIEYESPIIRDVFL